jgi:hypothetical protein
MRTGEMQTPAAHEKLEPPSDDPRGDPATITSGRSEWTPVGVFIGVAIAIAVVFAVALVAVAIAYVVS